MKQPYEGPKNPIYPIHQVADQRCFQNYHRFVSHKTTEEDTLRDLQEAEGSQEAEDFQEAEGSQEAEDFPEEVDTQVAAEYHPEDHPEEDGDHHRFPCLRLNKESWSGHLLQSTTEIGRRRPSLSTNGSYTGPSTTTTPS